MRRALLRRLAMLLRGAAALLLLSAATRYLWVALPPTAMLLGNGWAASAYRGIGELPGVIDAGSLDGVRVHVLRTASTERFAAPGFYARELAHWQTLVDALGADAASANDADVIVVPHALCLDDAARATLQRQLRRGRGVLTTGELGARDGDCRPAADTLLHDWLGGGGDVAPMQPAADGSYYAVVLGGSALGARLPPGARIELMPAGQLVFRGRERDVFYADFQRRPDALGDEAFFDGAIARSLVADGRVAAFGFALDDVVPGWSTKIAHAVAVNALQWAAGNAIVEIAPWPDAARAAVAFTQDVEHEFANGLPAARLLREHGVPVASYLLGSEATTQPGIARALAALGEAGSHTVDHRPLDQHSLRGQTRQLAWAQRTMQKTVGTNAAGLRPPEERFNAQTLAAWHAVGGEYVFAANDYRSAAPELVPSGGDTLVLLPRGTIDDFDLIVRRGLRDNDVMTRMLIAELHASVALRGLHMFSFHSQLMARPALRPVLAAVADAAAADPSLWIAEPRDIARWWHARSRITLSTTRANSPTGDGRVMLVRNTGASAITGAVVSIHRSNGTVENLPLSTLHPGQAVEVPLETP